MRGLLYLLRGGKSSSHPSQKRSAPRSFFFCGWEGSQGGPPAPNPHPRPLSHRTPPDRERGGSAEATWLVGCPPETVMARIAHPTGNSGHGAFPLPRLG